jgi:hypothetical protein
LSSIQPAPQQTFQFYVAIAQDVIADPNFVQAAEDALVAPQIDVIIQTAAINLLIKININDILLKKEKHVNRY